MNEAPPAAKPQEARTPSAPGPAAPPPPPPAGAQSNRRPWIFAALGLAVLLLLALVFVVPDFYAKETNDAYVDAHVISVIPKVPAYVQKLYVDDNSKVQAGQLLIELDPRDYAVQLAQAKASLANAEGKLQEARDQIPVADAEVARQRAELDVARANEKLAEINLSRLQSVSDVRAVSSQRVDEGKAAATSTHAETQAAQVRIAAAEAQAKLARSQAATADAAVGLARAALDQAELNLSYTKIYATEAGSVARKSVETGNYVQPGQLLLSVVPEHLYVIANYKETQLTHVRPGQRVTITVDAFADHELRGHVDSIQRGTGSRFALLPPENATGNFVKIVQRVPVKIEFDDPGEALKWISPGMSVETRIFVREQPRWLGFLN
ncbi:HlyD family secretion protein [Trinickia violacea]|uniref:HlyD family secretion protein n=1 Tax=Trinickia violacea TaxID=2571746 RepID=A0A4P8IWB7_9BURK|nr:HlyD family secretion protein [Trinickia violacea]QCP53628.1 HlyD family secretion protein [Trinickia violacea]